MRNTTYTSNVEVLEMMQSTGHNEGVDLDETKTTCKYVKIISECEYNGYYVIPINALKRTNKGLWVKKVNLLARVEGIEFTEVYKYLDKNAKVYDGYIPDFIDIRLNKHKNKPVL